MQYNIDLDKYLNSRNLLLTPNQRLARKLIAETNERYSKGILPAINIRSFNDYTDYLYNLITESAFLSKTYYLIDSWQREIIFKDIIKKNNTIESSDYSQVIVPESILNKAIQAWDIAHNWKLDWSCWKDYPQPESQLFCQWVDLYEQYLVEHQYIDASQKIVYITQHLDKLIIDKLKISNIDLYGFDDISPVQQSFFDKLAVLGVFVREKAVIAVSSTDPLAGMEVKTSSNRNKQLYIANNQEQEYIELALWAKEKLAAQKSNIGIIVPNLSQHRDKIIQYFEKTITDRQAWNISGGEVLSDVPIVKSGLILLELVIYQKLSLDNLRYLLNSSYYLKYSTQAQERYKIDSGISLIIAKLKTFGYKEVTLETILEHLSNINIIFGEKLEQSLAKIQSSAEQLINLPSKWAVIFSEFLSELGWPADNQNNINSLEYQALGQLQKNLSKLNLLDKLFGSTTAKKTYKELKLLLNNASFQIETDNNKIDILGMLEGAGLIYDELWLFNLTSEVWPATPQPNPFIPIDLQIQYKLPQATAERELEYAQKLTKRYLQSSDNIIVSYTKVDQDKENNLSSLFDNDNFAKYLVIEATCSTTRIIDKKIPLVLVIDNNGPSVEQAYIKSGINALSLQAQCPFRAFAETRLGARRVFELNIGPAHWMRGQIIHKVLELIFVEYNSKDKLSLLITNYESYKEYLNNLIGKVIGSYASQYRNIFTQGIIKIERELIFNIVNLWLEYELTRYNFIVEAVEQEYVITVCDLKFKVRVDRIDRIYYGDNFISDSPKKDYGLLIIDYKTSKQNINNLLKEKITNLQLPVYLVIDKLSDQVQAVGYAEVLEEHLGFNGISQTGFMNQGCVQIEDWSNLISNWQANLETLAKDYSSGNALIKPINKQQTCRDCHLDSFCRKDELCQI